MSFKLLREEGPVMKRYIIYIVGLILFFAFQEQVGSSLVLLAEQSKSTFMGWAIPSTLIMSINPLVIIACGGLVAWATMHLVQGRYPLALLLTALVFAVIYWQEKLSGLELIPLVALLSLAELLVGPFMYSYASNIAKPHTSGRIMGMLPLGFALASCLGGFLSKRVSASGPTGFLEMALIALVSAGLLWILLSSKRTTYASTETAY